MKKRKIEKNAVAEAVAAVGGPTKAARLCGVSNAAVHRWMKSGTVILLRHALRLSQASGVSIEKFLGEDDAKAEEQSKTPRAR
jgi:DNA-binding transcriptional regulator YdaS (Cro superfamily)